MSIPPLQQTLDQYMAYAHSTLRLNEALNAELKTCYDRIDEMTRDLTQSQNIQDEYVERIAELETRLQQMEASKQVYSARTGTTERISSAGDVNQYLVDGGNKGNSQKDSNRRRTKHRQTHNSLEDLNDESHCLAHVGNKQNPVNVLEIATLVKQKQHLLSELYSNQQQISTLRSKVTACQTELQKSLFKREQSEAAALRNIQSLTQHYDALKMQLTRKEEIISVHQESLRIQEYELERSRIRVSKVRQLEETISLLHRRSKQLDSLDSLKDTNKTLTSTLIHLQQTITTVESENRSLKSIVKELQRKHIRSPDNTHTRFPLPETELKMVKQEYTQSIKQNIALTEANSRLQKKRAELTRELETVRREKVEIEYQYKELCIENEYTLKQLHKQTAIAQHMSNRIATQENESHETRSVASKETILRLEKSVSPKMGNRRGMMRRRGEEEIPVRDVSRECSKLSKCKSTIITVNPI